MSTLESRLLPFLLALGGSAAALPAQFLSFGSGCPGSVGTPRISIPRSDHVAHGEFLEIRSDAVPTGASAVLFLGFDRFDPGIDLGVAGMPGCELYVQTPLSLTGVIIGNEASVFVPLSGVPSCFEFYAQYAILDPAANPLGVVLSDGATVRLDPAVDSLWHTATAANSSSNSTRISHPSIDGEPGAIMLQTRRPPGASFADDTSVTGLYYTGSQWAIFNQDLTPMLTGGSALSVRDTYNVFLPNSAACQFVVRADVSATLTGRIRIDHPELNGNPDAIVFASQVWNPGGGSGVYNDHEFDVTYSGGYWHVFNIGAPFPFGAAFNVVIGNDRLALEHAPFVHSATNGNAVPSGTRLDHPGLNGEPNANVIVTKRFSDPGSIQVADPISVIYDAGHWVIRNQTGSPIPPGADFNVLVAPENPRGNSFVYTADPLSISGNSTTIAGLEDLSDGPVLVTQNWEPNSIYNPHPIGVFFNLFGGWSIFNQDLAAMPSGASFNVLVPNPGATSFVATATSPFANWFEINHPALNARPNANLFVTQFYEAGGSGVYNANNVGVWYSAATARWNVFNQSGASMPAGAKFFVVVDDGALSSDGSFTHRATASNTSGQITTLDHPSLNGNPDAVIFVTQEWVEFAAGGTQIYNDHSVGVYYANGSWRIFNQDLVPLPLGAEFKVLISGECE